MPFQTPAVKSVGGTISRAELIDFLENLEWFFTPPAYRLYSTGGETVETTLATMDYAPPGFHAEWREEGAGNPDDITYHTGTDGLWVNVGDVAAGLWLNGVMFAVRNVATAVGGQVARSLQVQLRRGDGSTWTELADYVSEDRNSGRRGAVHLSGLGTFSSGTDRVEVRARVSSGSPVVVGDRRWGVRFGDQTNFTTDYAAARQISDTNVETINAFNRLRANQVRIERRPSAQRWKSGADQSVSATTATTVGMASSDWASDAGMTSAADRIDIEQSGVYLVTGQVTLAGYTSAASFATITMQDVAGADVSTIVSANAPEADNYATVVPVCDLVELDASRYVRTTVTTGTSSTVAANRGTHMTATLMSSNQGVSPNRQVWDRMPAPATWPKVADMSSDRSPAGTMRVLSDLTDRVWHRPAFKAQLSDDAEIKMGSGWTNVDVDTIVFDYTSLEGTHGRRLLSGGALVLPWGGIWLVGARLSFSSQSVDGAGIGNQGVRGMRLVLGERQSVGAFIGAAMNNAGHGWTRTLMETVVVNRDEGQEIRLQGLAAPSIGGVAELTSGLATLADSGGSDNAADIVELADAVGTLSTLVDSSDYEIPINAAHLWAVELGEGIVRDPS